MNGRLQSFSVSPLYGNGDSPQTPVSVSVHCQACRFSHTYVWWVEHDEIPSLTLVLFVKLPRRALREHLASTVLLQRWSGTTLLLDDFRRLLVPVLFREHQRRVRDVMYSGA
jgi:hypothetical protein